jgi:hypothetical protein
VNSHAILCNLGQGHDVRRGAPNGSPGPFTSTLLFRPAGKPEATTPFLGRVPLQPYWSPLWWPDTQPGESNGQNRAAPAPAVPSRQAAPSLIQPSPTATLPRSESKPTGVLQLDVQPRDAHVYVDGFSVGTVDAIDARGGLALSAGWHRVEFRVSGYETVAVDVTIEADRTIVSRRTLRPTPSS